MRSPEVLLFSFATVLSFVFPVLAKQAQFYDMTAEYGLAISSTTDGGGENFMLQISAPVSYGWAAAGTGKKMDKSLMFIIYPSAQDDHVTLSVRTANGHDTPESTPGVNATLLSSEIQQGRMKATIAWHQDPAHKYSAVRITSSKQAWIWAVGPTDKQVTNEGSTNAGIEQHAKYGVVFVNMPATQNTVATLPIITGTSSIHAQSQPSNYNSLLYAHAILLSLAFVVVFPLGVIGLRMKWMLAFKIHWILQVVATFAAYVGLALAIALSVTGIEYADFQQGHQGLGLAVVGLLSLQVLLGYVHHRKYISIGQRTVPSYLHIGLGRIAIYAGMVNAILGGLLSDDTSIAAAVGSVSAVLAVSVEYMSLRYRRRQRTLQELSSKSSSRIALNIL